MPSLRRPFSRRPTSTKFCRRGRVPGVVFLVLSFIKSGWKWGSCGGSKFWPSHWLGISLIQQLVATAQAVIICTEATLWRKKLIISAKLVDSNCCKWQAIENAAITILGVKGSNEGIKLFFCVYSGPWGTFCELSAVTIGPKVCLLWYENLPVENALRGQKMGQNRGKSHRIFTQNKLDLTFRAPHHCAKFHQNRIKIAAIRVFTDRKTVWQKWFYNLSHAML